MNKSSPKIVTAEKAVQAIKSHDDVVLANFCGEPRFLPVALLNRARELLGVRIFHFAALASRADTQKPFGSGQDTAQAKDEEGVKMLWVKERAARAGFRPYQASTRIQPVPITWSG